MVREEERSHMSFYRMTAADLLNGYRKKQFSPVEAVQALFARIDRLNPEINAFVTLNREDALKQARQSEAHCIKGTVRPLEGVPVGIKDLTNTKGLRTTYGSLVYKNNIPTRDATIVERLKQAGAIVIGKTNTPEFGHKGTTNNRLFGATRNPWKLSNGTGGSSGGSAAAVAAGFVPLAEGGDGGGSIRIPSASCGVFGFKPSFGRVPAGNRLDSVFAQTVPFISHGPISRTVDDAALMFDVIKGLSDHDPFSLDGSGCSAALAIHRSRKDGERRNRFRIGYTPDFGIYPLNSEIRKIFFDTLDRLREWGAAVEPAAIRMNRDLQGYVRYFNRLWMVGLAAGSRKLMEKHQDELSESLISMIHRGMDASAEEYIDMNRYRTYLWHMFQGAMGKFDVIVSPTLGAVEYGFEEEGPSEINGRPINAESDWMMTSPVNLIGHPACSLPIGFTEAGLPVGMQCIGHRPEDTALFAFAAWAERRLHVSTLAPVSKR